MTDERDTLGELDEELAGWVREGQLHPAFVAAVKRQLVEIERKNPPEWDGARRFVAALVLAGNEGYERRS